MVSYTSQPKHKKHQKASTDFAEDVIRWETSRYSAVELTTIVADRKRSSMY